MYNFRLYEVVGWEISTSIWRQHGVGWQIKTLSRNTFMESEGVLASCIKTTKHTSVMESLEGSNCLTRSTLGLGGRGFGGGLINNVSGKVPWGRWEIKSHFSAYLWLERVVGSLINNQQDRCTWCWWGVKPDTPDIHGGGGGCGLFFQQGCENGRWSWWGHNEKCDLAMESEEFVACSFNRRHEDARWRRCGFRKGR
ncbi:uncharacterized protein BDZ99DRAFT_43467 [Mytilinidion resinicola]|uniref:Uncharacterized protein n=1 Tax=Mytilinidion resinicola TaxID=574789 RepID=A0A6A6YLZ2_9PEZI|nr:uncharacterized protein BDZ99DRAFT_43467 [Mytilinidion resinicola]KAF2808995.1 hypothetical protein BDZ99DRAFT_43467 [Mytilinidion resinicola]